VNVAVRRVVIDRVVVRGAGLDAATPRRVRASAAEAVRAAVSGTGEAAARPGDGDVTGAVSGAVAGAVAAAVRRRLGPP
jgi:hypothetical protein